MSRVSSLHRLQQIDLALDRASVRIEEIEQILADEEEIVQKRKILQHSEDELRTTRAAHARADDAVSSQRAKLEQTERTLYGGTVRNPKELQDRQQEAESLKRYLVTLEDRLLDAMIELEEVEKVHRAASEDLAKTEAARSSQHQDLVKEREQLTLEITRCEAEREAAIADVDTEARKLYDDLRERFSGMVISMVKDSNCSVCGVELASSVLQEIRTGDNLIRCRQCGRIMYAG